MASVTIAEKDRRWATYSLVLVIGAFLMICPTGQNVLIKEIPQDKWGLIDKPQDYNTKHLIGEVVAVGPGNWMKGIPEVDWDGAVIEWEPVRRPMETKVGDKVIFHRHARDEVWIDGVQYLKVIEDNIMAVFDG